MDQAEFLLVDALDSDDEDQCSKDTTVEMRDAGSFPLPTENERGCHQHPRAPSSALNDCSFTRAGNAKMSVVQVEERPGRASLHQFLHALENAERPGLFTCGPTALMRDLRVVTQERCLMRLQRCDFAGKPPIALYEESFEM